MPGQPKASEQYKTLYNLDGICTGNEEDVELERSLRSNKNKLIGLKLSSAINLNPFIAFALTVHNENSVNHRKFG